MDRVARRLVADLNVTIGVASASPFTMAGERVVTFNRDWLISLLQRCVETLDGLEPEPSSGTSADNDGAPE